MWCGGVDNHDDFTAPLSAEHHGHQSAIRVGALCLKVGLVLLGAGFQTPMAASDLVTELRQPRMNQTAAYKEKRSKK